MSFDLDGPLVMAGAGKMGGALVAGWLARGLAPSRIVVQDPSPPAEVAALLASHGIALTAAIDRLAAPPAVVVMAVKPQVMDAVLAPLARLVGPNTLVLSIAAGRSLVSFERLLPRGTGVVRAMPNTPAAIGHGMTVCVANASAGAAQRALADRLMAAVGAVAWIEDERQMDAVTAVSGSGPAYIFLLAECLAAAGVAEGLDEALARQLARETIAGAGALMCQSGVDPAELRRNVTSPGGTTAAALAVLMGEDGLERLIRRAVAEATKRGRELAG